jgi:hypothetical protein
MISHVMIIGEIDAVVSDNTRFIKFQRPYRDAHGIFSEDKFPIQYWSKATNNYFMNMKMGLYQMVHGSVKIMKWLLILKMVVDIPRLKDGLK